MKWITQSFRNLLVAALVSLVVLLGLPTFLYINLVHTRQLVAERGHNLHHLAKTASTVIAENLRERSREVALLAQTPLYVRAPLDSPEFRASLKRVQQSYPSYSWMGLTDLEGTVRAATGDLLVGQNVAPRPWFQHAQQGMYVGDLHEATLLAKLLPAQPAQEGPLRFIDFAVPVRNEAGQPRAILGVHITWAWAADLVKRVTPQEAVEAGLEIFIVNRDNQIIFPDQSARASGDHTVPRVTVSAGAEEHRWGGATPFLTAASAIADPVSTVPLGWKVVVRQPTAKALQHATELQRVITVVCTVVLLAFILLAWLLGRQLGRPIQQLTRIAQAIARGQPANFNLTVHTTEVRTLNDALREMSTQLLHQQHDLAAAAQDLEHKVALRTQELAQANEQLTALARRDALTGLPNRLAVNEFLAHEFPLLKRRPVPYTVVLIDIDHFKRVNDTHGHAVGDDVLKHVGGLLMRAVRESDFVGRLGGEEFIAILPMTSLADALGVAEKIRAQIEASPVAPVGVLTISLGVAVAQADHVSVDVAIQQADAMLYEAKRAGRNRVMPQLA